MNPQKLRKRTARAISLACLFALASNAIALAASGTWSSTGNTRLARDGHTSTLLPNGKVLIAGGTNNGVALASAELKLDCRNLVQYGQHARGPYTWPVLAAPRRISVGRWRLRQ